jgi:hypothetical protein
VIRQACWREPRFSPPRRVTLPFRSRGPGPRMPSPDGEPLPSGQPPRGGTRLRGDLPVPCHPPDLRRAALTAMPGLPRARPLPDPVEYATIPLIGFRVIAQPGPAAEAEDREAGTATRRATPAAGRYRLENAPEGGTRWVRIGRADCRPCRPRITPRSGTSSAASSPLRLASRTAVPARHPADGLWAVRSRSAIMAVGCEGPCPRTAGQAVLEYMA